MPLILVDEQIQKAGPSLLGGGPFAHRRRSQQQEDRKSVNPSTKTSSFVNRNNDSMATNETEQTHGGSVDDDVVGTATARTMSLQRGHSTTAVTACDNAETSNVGSDHSDLQRTASLSNRLKRALSLSSDHNHHSASSPRHHNQSHRRRRSSTTKRASLTESVDLPSLTMWTTSTAETEKTKAMMTTTSVSDEKITSSAKIATPTGNDEDNASDAQQKKRHLQDGTTPASSSSLSMFDGGTEATWSMGSSSCRSSRGWLSSFASSIVSSSSSSSVEVVEEKDESTPSAAHVGRDGKNGEKKKKKEKSVRFSSVTIYCHGIMLGDNPFVSSGT